MLDEKIASVLSSAARKTKKIDMVVFEEKKIKRNILLLISM
jgi:hypothetical protein